MEFFCDANQLKSAVAMRKNLFLLTNGLGGYSSATCAFSVPRCDQGVLVSAEKAPNVRISLVHRLSETLTCGDETAWLSTQTFADETPAEDGYHYLTGCAFAHVPSWDYEVNGVRIRRQCAMQQGENAVAVLYTLENTTDKASTLCVTPYFKFAPKEEALKRTKALSFRDGYVSDGNYGVWVKTNGKLLQTVPNWQMLAYPEDAEDGRPEKGMAGTCCAVSKTVEAGQKAKLEIVFSAAETDISGWNVLKANLDRMQKLESDCNFDDPIARQLVLAADAYIANRESTGGKTILAGYPLFGDWGRDTMIALPGCCRATSRYEDAKSILRTFLAYEKDGLVPNLFPEGDQTPMYNTVDAALLLIDAVWQYVQATRDWAFAWEAWDVMDRIITHYRKGTHHGIGMDEDGLIFAGKGLDQVTWMDVCVNGVLPTPRHGKPVEINAYWYNALMIMDHLAKTLGHDEKDYARLAELVKESFVQKFYIPEKGYLRDVLSGTDADAQIRCNQIWALVMPFTMLNHKQALCVLKTVKTHLYTPYGLRTLSPEDPQYHPYYGGVQFDRDMAYHQGTVWVFPMGAYYRAVLILLGKEGVAQVKAGLANLEGMLRQGCTGQLPEIYDGENPGEGKGCFAQAWSVGEMLRVYEALRKMEKEHNDEAK